MDEFTWQDDCRIGDDTIDAEHQHLFGLANQVEQLTGQNEDPEKIREAVLALCEYVKTHFSN